MRPFTQKHVLRIPLAGMLALLLVSLLVGTGWGNGGIFRGPYLNDVRTDSIVVRWDTNAP